MYKVSETTLYRAFFTQSNYTRINNLIRDAVYTKARVQIGPQNQADLYNLMQSVYSVNSVHYDGNIQSQVEWMNSIVVQKAVRQILSGLMMQRQYQSDITSLPAPTSLPVSTTQYGKKFGTDSRPGW